jgi:acyl carrier protein
MTKEEIFDRLKTVLQESFGTPVEEIKLTTSLFEDLDMDSIDAVDLMVRLRSLTERRLQPEEFRTVRTVGDVVHVLHAHLLEKV